MNGLVEWIERGFLNLLGSLNMNSISTFISYIFTGKFRSFLVHLDKRRDKKTLFTNGNYAEMMLNVLGKYAALSLFGIAITGVITNVSSFLFMASIGGIGIMLMALLGVILRIMAYLVLYVLLYFCISEMAKKGVYVSFTVLRYLAILIMLISWYFIVSYLISLYDMVISLVSSLGTTYSALFITPAAILIVASLFVIARQSILNEFFEKMEEAVNNMSEESIQDIVKSSVSTDENTWNQDDTPKDNSPTDDSQNIPSSIDFSKDSDMGTDSKEDNGDNKD